MKFFIPLLGCLLVGTSAFAQLNVRALKIENQTDPIGMGVTQPRFSWQLTSDQRNVKQTAYEIQVKAGKKAVWSSGKVANEKSVFNSYQGTPLQSNTAYTWQVRVWDNQGHTSGWANAQSAGDAAATKYSSGPWATGCTAPSRASIPTKATARATSTRL